MLATVWLLRRMEGGHEVRRICVTEPKWGSRCRVWNVGNCEFMDNRLVPDAQWEQLKFNKLAECSVLMHWSDNARYVMRKIAERGGVAECHGASGAKYGDIRLVFKPVLANCQHCGVGLPELRSPEPVAGPLDGKLAQVNHWYVVCETLGCGQHGPIRDTKNQAARAWAKQNEGA